MKLPMTQITEAMLRVAADKEAPNERSAADPQANAPRHAGNKQPLTAEQRRTLLSKIQATHTEREGQRDVPVYVTSDEAQAAVRRAGGGTAVLGAAEAAGNTWARAARRGLIAKQVRALIALIWCTL